MNLTTLKYQGTGSPWTPGPILATSGGTKDILLCFNVRRAFYKTWTFYKNGLASLDLLFGKDIQAVLLSLAPRLE